MSTWGAIRVSLGVMAVCLGAILVMAAVPAAITASAINASVGRSGVVAQSLGTLQAATGDRAVVIDDVSAALVAPEAPELIDEWLAAVGTDVQELAEQAGTVVLIATMSTDAPGFLGVAPVDAVNTYLDGAPYSVAVPPTGDVAVWPTVSVPGTATPGVPEREGLWTEQASGTAPEIPGSALDSGTVVLMRSDGAPDPKATLRLEYRVPGADIALQSAAISAAAASLGGVALIALGAFLIVGLRHRP